MYNKKVFMLSSYFFYGYAVKTFSTNHFIISNSVHEIRIYLCYLVFLPFPAPVAPFMPLMLFMSSGSISVNTPLVIVFSYFNRTIATIHNSISKYSFFDPFSQAYIYFNKKYNQWELKKYRRWYELRCI
jgi:hypothetical protein